MEEELEELRNIGAAGDSLVEPVPKFIYRSGDVELKNENNAWIILGRDRPNKVVSGYGAYSAPLGERAGCIDLVVGRTANSNKSLSSNLEVNNDFFNDSARIYISQKTDVDINFGIPSEEKLLERSAIAIKADLVRVVGREGIKLVTGVLEGEKNSLGHDSILKIHGIHLIAGYANENIDLQPLVKGDNLKNALSSLVQEMENLSGLLTTFMTEQIKFNTVISMHYHNSPFYGYPSTPSGDALIEGVRSNMNLLSDCVMKVKDWISNTAKFKFDYLTPKNSKTYINSNFNKTN